MRHKTDARTCVQHSGRAFNFFLFFSAHQHLSIYLSPPIYLRIFVTSWTFFSRAGHEWWGVFNRCADRIRYCLWTWKFDSLIRVKGGQSPEAHRASYFICLHSKTTRQMIVETRYFPNGENTISSSDVSAHYYPCRCHFLFILMFFLS